MQSFFFFFLRYKSILFLFLCWFMSLTKENMQHMTSGTHTINRSHEPCVDVTPPGPSNTIKITNLNRKDQPQK